MESDSSGHLHCGSWRQFGVPRGRGEVGNPSGDGPETLGIWISQEVGGKKDEDGWM